MHSSFFEDLATDLIPLASYQTFKTIDDLNGPGIYSFWWTGSLDFLRELYRKVDFKGKKLTARDKEVSTHSVHTEYSGHKHTWEVERVEPICMYIGKSSNIARRIELHLDVASRDKEWYRPFSKRVNGVLKEFEPSKEHDDLVKHTSACQMRAGIEHLFKYTDLPFSKKLEHFSIGVVKEESFAERFYLECLAIGHFRPWFNLDCER